ncbi:MAG: hypothetical protein CK604_06235 [Curvibacter sp. PD_MW3]|nr:MAG: hypothetical protein CK604_06235 [Curvibacter sp. PD_MW3]
MAKPGRRPSSPDPGPFHPDIEAVLARVRADIDALAAYEPRKQAIGLILGRKLDDYLVWHFGEGAAAAYGRTYSRSVKCKPGYEAVCFFKPTPLDEAISKRAEYHGGEARFGRDAMALVSDYALRYASERVEHFHRSPFEIVLENGADLGLLENMFAYWSDPKATCERGSVKTFARGWEARELYIGNSPKRKLLEEDIEASALVRALVEGRTDIADLLARHRLAGNPRYINARLFHYFLEHRRELETLCAEMGIQPDFFSAENWLTDREENMEDIVRLARQAGPWPKLDEMREIARSGACSGDSTIFGLAAQRGEDDLIYDLFESGAEPNGHGDYGSAIDMIESLKDQDKVLEVLKLWAGAGGSVDGDWADAVPLKMSPSEEWICRDRPELVELARSWVLSTQPIRKNLNGEWWNRLLAKALERNARNSIRWLIEDQGCRLDDRDEASGQPARSFAKGDTLAFAVALEERLALTADPFTPTDKGSGPQRI